MIRLIGPGGAGKSTIGALLAERLDVPFVDLDRHLVGRVGDISEYIGRHGYDAYARENIEAYRSVFREGIRPGVVALSSGFMTYALDAHSEYGRIRGDIEECAHTFILLPSLDLKRGTVYVTLGRMEDKGYITSRLDDAPPDAGGLPRRVYQPTALGRRVLKAWTTASAHVMPEFAR